MFKLVGIFLILAAIQISESAPVYQFLPPREGYVPVYIRLGDTPLDEINPDLALAFHESSLETRNVNDLEETMQNDAPNYEDLSESVEDVKDKVSITQESSSEEDPKPEAQVKSTDDESDSVEKIEAPQKKSSVSDSKSDEESQEKPAEIGNEEIVEPASSSSSTANTAESDDSSSEEATMSKRNVTVPPPPPPPSSSAEEHSSEEGVQQKPSSSNESNSSEEVENKS